MQDNAFHRETYSALKQQTPARDEHSHIILLKMLKKKVMGSEDCYENKKNRNSKLQTVYPSSN